MERKQFLKTLGTGLLMPLLVACAVHLIWMMKFGNLVEAYWFLMRTHLQGKDLGQ